MTDKKTPHFSSFIWAGFECTAALAAGRKRLNLLSASKHDEYCRDDYCRLKSLGITTVREGLNWSKIDKGNNEYDFSRFENIMKIGEEEGMQQIWDLNHFDYPISVDPFSPEFVTRFAEYGRRAINLIRKYQKGTIYIVPICEISFFAWIGADQGHWAPYLKGSSNGFRFKKQLVLATMAVIDAIRAEDNNVRFILVDPFMRRFARGKNPSKKALAHVDDFNNVVRFEAWDMLYGKTYPELGGNPDYLDIVGVNYYQHNQEWVLSSKRYPTRIGHRMMSWDSKDRISFASMLKDIHDRYNRPMVVSETGSVGRLRFRWWDRTLREIKEGIDSGLPIHGVCAYPTIDRPDWAGFLLPRSGLWDLNQEDATCERLPHRPSLDLIREYSHKF